MPDHETITTSRVDSIRTRLILAFVSVVLVPMISISAMLAVSTSEGAQAHLAAQRKVQQAPTESVRATLVLLAVDASVALAAILIAVFASLSVTHSIAMPLDDLSETAARIAAGNLELTAEVKRKDEIGALAQTFNFMTGRLRQTMEGLRKSEEQYRTLVENINIGIYRNTPGRGGFLQANPAIARIFGYNSVEEFMGVSVAGLYLDPEDRKHFLAEVQRLGSVKNSELQMRKKDGTPIWCSATAAAHFDEHDEIIWMDGVIEDITERKQAEDALRESEGKYHTLVDNLTVGVYRTSFDGRFLQINPAMAKIFGHDTAEQLMKTPVNNIYQNPEDRMLFFNKIRAKGTVRDVEIAMRKKDGTPIWASLSVTAQFDKQGEIQYVDGILEDITERKRTEEVLRKAHDELETRVIERTSELSNAHEQLRQRHAETSILYRISSVISQTIQMEEMLAEVLKALAGFDLFMMEKGVIFIIEGERMKPLAHVGHSKAFMDLHKDMKIGDCLCGTAVKTGEIIVSPDSRKDSRHTMLNPDMPPHGHAIVPLKTKDTVEGVLELYTPVGLEYDEDKIKLLQSIANQLGIAIENTRLYEATKSLSLHDSLTGLWNHEEIHRILDQELARAEREEASVAVIMADLDHFKKVNDTYGHMAGDAVLRETAARMRSLVRPYDAVGRYGGEEFILVLPACDGTHVAAVAERLRKLIGDKEINTPEGVIPVTVSLGVAASDKGKRRDQESLVRAADSALYRAKKNGRNRVEAASER